jgi:hypothetical protein
MYLLTCIYFYICFLYVCLIVWSTLFEWRIHILRPLVVIYLSQYDHHYTHIRLI